MFDLMLNETDSKNFYPTPASLVRKMFDKIPYKEWKFIESVLEPSAGKGDIVKLLYDKMKPSYTFSYVNDKVKEPDIDCIEIDANMRAILLDNKYRVVFDDFLSYNTMKNYDLIIMNPPFDNGDKHLLKALSMQERGGKILCLLNAETLINLCSNTRKDLVRKLNEYNADIEFIENAFAQAERKTGVNIALIYVDIPKVVISDESFVVENLKKAKKVEEENFEASELIEGSDFVKQIVDQYNFEIQIGIGLIREVKAAQPYIMQDVNTEKNPNSMLHLNIMSENEYVETVRHKYWNALFRNDKFTAGLTSNLITDYYNQISKLIEYDFNVFNIKSIQAELSKKRVQGIEETILKLFDEFSHKHHWYDETSNNVHYYNGWKTNKAYMINKKVIIPLDAYSWHDKRYDPDYRVREKVNDMIQVLDFLDGEKQGKDDVHEILKKSKEDGVTKKIHFKNIDITFYKKGTCHIEFTNAELLKRFNIFGSQKKGWLPPTYCKKHYKDMSVEEQEVINEFEGEKEYEKVFANQNRYLLNTQSMLMLTAGA